MLQSIFNDDYNQFVFKGNFLNQMFLERKDKVSNGGWVRGWRGRLIESMVLGSCL